MKTTLIALLFALPVLAQDYRFDEIKRTVKLNDAQISKGDHAKGGDSVETGWFSYARIATENHAAKFEIYGSTEVKLADGTPGVILSVERGRIRAAFDKITGTEPRVVKTPGALLAVRGTQFDVRVDANGNTTVDVYEGVVELQSPLQMQPIFVRAGEESTHGPRRPPTTRPMPEHRRREDPTRDRGEEDRRGKDRDDDARREPRDTPPPPKPPQRRPG